MLDLSWITPELAIGGRFERAAAELLATIGLRAVIDLRDDACDEEASLRRAGLELLHAPTPDLCAIAPTLLQAGVAFARRHLDCGGRVLIHCEHGIGRSGLLGLCVLVDRGYAPLAALELVKSRRPKVSPSPAQYEAWAEWLRERAVVAPTFDAFALIAYRHLEA